MKLCIIYITCIYVFDLKKYNNYIIQLEVLNQS